MMQKSSQGCTASHIPVVDLQRRVMEPPSEDARLETDTWSTYHRKVVVESKPRRPGVAVQG